MASHDSRRQQQQQQQQQPYLRWRASPSNRRNNASTSRIHPVQPRRIAVLDNQHLVAPQTTILEHQYQQQQYQQLEEEEEERYQAPSRPVPVLISPDNSPMAIASSEDPMLLLGSGAEDTTGNTTCTAGTPKQTANNYSNFNNLRRKQRPLHNSHRKKVLHHITPLRREQQLPQSLSHLRHHPHPPPPAMGVQHRGNGVVLDLTSLFWQQTNPEKPQLPPSPTETATTAMSTAHNQHNNNNNHSTTNIQNNNSNVTPHTAGAAPTPTHGHYHHNHNHWRASPVSLLPQEEEDTDELSLLGQGWDTKSQTTQEALITERQCQALFQWLNYVLVGHEEGATATATGQHEEDKDTRGMGLTSSNNTTIQQSASQESSMDDHDDDKHDKVAASTSKRNNNASSATRAGARTPTKTRTITPPRTRNKSTKTTDTPQSQSRRASSFQYTQTYSHTQQQARHWFAHSQVWKDIRARIKSEITRKNFQLREDRNLYANVACRRQILELLLSYRPAWLTLALEILLDDTLIKHNNSNKATDSYALPSNSQLKQCITQRILHDDKLLNKYNQGRGSRVPSGQFEEQYLAELRPLVLYRLMVLIFFLDRAATKFQHVLGNVFAPSASVKSTKDVLVILCREFMSKQGDIVKQLTRANLPCTYEQHPLQEIDFTVTNFAVDLRDGVRLCRILEVLWMSSRKEEFPLLQQLRIPAISRLQKIHNVNVALQTLTKECSVNADSVWVLPRDMQAHHIVDGHRRMVMRLIWTIVLMHCFDHSDILTREQLQLEIRQLQREHSSLMDRERQEHLERQSSLLLLEQETDAIDSVTAMSDDEGELFSSPSKSQSIVRKPASSSATHSHEHFSEPRVATSGSFSFDGNESCNSGMPLEEIPLVQQWKSLLFHWCQQVCMIVEEKYSSTDDKKPSHSSSQRKWTSSDLINGKAVCCLIHYYHPELLSAAELRLNSTFIDGPPTNIVSGPEMAPKQSFQRTRDQMCNPKIAPDYYTRLAHRRLSDLGGMIFLPYSHQKHSHHHGRLVAPLGEEKSTVVFIYHVCARLLESRHQVEALTRIQCWYRYRRWLSSWKRKRGAARVALTHWKDNKNNYYQNRRKKYARSTRIIESFVASNFDKLLILKERRLERELQGFAATTIQTKIRCVSAGKQYQRVRECHYATIAIQSRYRQYRDYVPYKLLKLQVLPAITTIQRHWRGFMCRREYTAQIDAAIKIQAFTRGAVLVRTCLLRSWYNASATIQKIWRGFWVQLHYQMDLMDIVAVQCFARTHIAFRLAQERKSAMEILQSSARCFLARKTLTLKRHQRDACTVLQSIARMHLAVQRAAKMRAMIWLANAILVIQRSWRRFLFIRERRWGATKIQTVHRMRVTQRRHLSKLSGALIIETKWRQYSKRSEYLRAYGSVVLIQSWLRKWYYGGIVVARRRRALQQLQNRCRMWIATRRMEDARLHRVHVIQQAIFCQALVRKKQCVKEWQRTRLAVLRLQRKWISFSWSRDAKRKSDLIASLLRCNKFFRRSLNRGFRIIPHTRRLVELEKQSYVKCGKKRIILTNAGTFVPCYAGRRQNLFYHRRHVKSLRARRTRGVGLEELPRQTIGLSALKKVNQAAMYFQVPWLHGHRKTGADVRCNPRTVSKEVFFRHRYQTTARRHLRTALGSLVRRSRDVEESDSGSLSYNKAVKSLLRAHHELSLTKSKPLQDLQGLRLKRTLTLIRRDMVRPLSKVVSTDRIVTGDVSGILVGQYAMASWAVRKLQARYRGYLIRRETKLNMSALKIQTAWRGFAGRSELFFLQLCVLTIQSTVRCVLQKKKFERTIAELQTSHTVRLQSYIRMLMKRSKFSRIRHASIDIQRFVRGFRVREKLSLKHFAATEIQKTWRSYSALVRFICFVVSAIKIQAVVRRFVTRRWTSELLRQRSEYLHHKIEYVATVSIQSFARMVLAKDLKAKLVQEKRVLAFVFKLQSFARMAVTISQTKKLLERRDTKLCAIKVQSLIRMVLAKKQADCVKSQSQAAVKIQSFIRMVNASKYLANSDLMQQRGCERKALMEKERLRISQERAAVTLQRAFKSFLAQMPRRRFLHRVSLSQGVIRGFLARRQATADVRRSITLIKEAELRSKLDPMMRLGRRMSRALELLKTSQSLTEIMNIVCTLELATRYSKECCEEFVIAKAPEILVSLIQTCNRSLPHVELLYYIMRTLSNVSKHDDLEMDIATLVAAESFLYLIRMYSEEDAIFCTAVKLLEFCALRNKEVDALINVPISRRRLLSLCSQWERKLSREFQFGKSGRNFKTPCFLGKQSKAKTDMLILGISYDLKEGVATLRRLLSLPVRPELLVTPSKNQRR